MLFMFNPGALTPGTTGKPGTPSVVPVPFMVMPKTLHGPGDGVMRVTFEPDNVSRVTREHVRFTEIENSRERNREKVIENVRFYHPNNSRAVGGPGASTPFRVPEPPRLGEHSASLAVPPDAAHIVQPGHSNPAETGTVENTKKIKIEQTDLDLEQFTHRVYGMLEQKIRQEKEMRGW
jgi:hypothetical protein